MVEQCGFEATPDRSPRSQRSLVRRNYIEIASVSPQADGRVGQVGQGQARYSLQVRFTGRARKSEADIKDIMVAAPGGAQIPLSQLAHFSEREGPIEIWRDNLQRRVTVAANVGCQRPSRRPWQL